MNLLVSQRESTDEHLADEDPADEDPADEDPADEDPVAGLKLWSSSSSSNPKKPC